MNTKFLRPLFCAALLTFAVSIRAAIPPAENLLPADTLLLVTVPDCAALRAALKQSPQWLLWNDPAMKPFHDKFIANFNAQLAGPLERDLGVNLGDFADLPQGQFTFAITQNGWNGADSAVPGEILLLDAKDKSDLLKTNLDALRKKWTEDGKPIHTETIRGIPFSVVPLATNDIPATLQNIFPKSQPTQELGQTTKSAAPGQLVIGQFDSLLIVGSSTKVVEPVLAHLTGSALPSLNDNSFFAADKLSQFRDQPLYYGWFNSKYFFGVLAKIPPAQPNPDAPSPMPQIPWNQIFGASGLTSLKSASFAFRQSAAGSQLNFFLSAPETSRQGILKIISTSAKDANPPVFVPADAVKFSRWRIDGQQSWAEIQKMLTAISPSVLNYLNSAIDIANAMAQQKDPAFDIRKYLFNNLGDDFISYEKSPAGNAPADSAPSILLFAAPNPDQAVLAIKNVAGMMYSQQGAPEPRDFLGRKIYTIPMPASSLSATSNAAPRAIYCSSGSGYVALTDDLPMLEEFLRSNQNQNTPLRATAGLADAAQQIGGAGNGLFGYENQREIMRTAFQKLKNNPANSASQSPIPGSVFLGLTSQLADYSLLPDYNQVSKYFYFSVYNGDTTADGISFKIFAPRPPQMQ